MIGVMEKTLEEAALEKEEVSVPKQKKAEVKTPSITNFFKPPSKPTPQTEESKPTDLRNYFQVTKKNVVPDQPKISSDQNCQEDSSLKVEKANAIEDGDSKLKRNKRGGEVKQVCKKPKKHKSDSNLKSDDEDRDFESPPKNRRKRKSRLDSDSIADFIDSEDSKQGHDLSENGSLQPLTGQDEMEVSESDGTEMPCNGEDAQNTSTIVSYEDFLRNSMEDEDNKESEIENETKDVVESVPKEVDHPPDSIMLTPPDSRCSQESPTGDQLATPPANQHTMKEEEANDSDTCLRKFITVKAQVHSPLDGRDKDSSPSASQMLNSETDSRKTGFGPRRLISNVCVPDSSPELRLISIETKDEPKKTGPVYNIFQPKATGFKKDVTKKELTKKESTKEEATKENKQEQSGHVKDLTKEKVKDNGEDDTEKRTMEKQKELPDKPDVVKTQDVDDNIAKGKKEKEGTIKKDSLTAKNKKLKRSKKVAVARKDRESQESPLASKPSSNSKSFVGEKETKEDSLIPPRRVLRARVSKASTDADSSLEEFEDVQPLKTKANKQTKKATPSSNKTSVKAEVKDKKRGSERSKTEHQKFKSSLMSGGKGQGPIRLKLTAIKASPKKNSKVTKAQQLLQKAKKGHQTTLVSKTLLSRQLVKKKNTQTTFPHSKSTAVSSKAEKAYSLNKKGKMEETKEKPAKKSEKKVGGGAQTPRRRSSSRNKPKTPPKPAAKLAPIFTKQGQLAAAKKFKQDSILAAIAESLPVDEASRDSLIDSKETMSDLSGPGLGFNMLEQLKMKPTLTQKDASMQLIKACHVLQKDDTNPLWKLPCPGLGNWKLKDDLEAKPQISQDMKLAPSSVSSPSISCKFKLFEGHPPVSESDKKAVMDEILRANPKFPIQKIFKMYQAKKNGETQKKDKDNSDVQASDQGTQEAAASSESVPTMKSSKLSRGKRKAEDKNDDDNARRKIARRSGTRGCAGRSLEAGLDGEPAEEVGDAEERSLRRSSRRSSRRVSREVEERKDGDGKGEEEQKAEKDGKKDTVVEESREEKRRAGLLWTEKYQPTAVSEMIGNTALCRKFSSWLTEWKKKTLRMKEKTRNAQRKDKRKSKGSRRIESDDESDDDFCCSDIEDSDEEDGLCNTILLSGPHGVGKTSLVYACAQELGFEVFEVNASSRRNGRQILAELGEGTQSHQVARQPGLSSTRFFNQFPSKSVSTKPASPKKKKKPALPKAFAGFVKIGSSSSSSTKRSPVKKASVKKSPKKAIKQSPIKKISSSQPPGSQAASTKPKITSTSLILFDEVDIIFEEDKGFLSTVMSFMESSKRPIVLTTSDPRFSFSLTSRYDELTFKPPPLNPLVSHLKLLCLAEDVPISHQDLRLVAEFFDRDIRRCLQHLQFWVSSGATPRSDSIQLGPDGEEDDKREHMIDAPRERISQGKPVSQSATSEMDTSDVGGDETRVGGAIVELTQELIDLETKIIAVGEYYSMKGYKPQDVLKMMDEMGLTSEKETPKDNETNSIQESLGQHSFRTGLGNYCGLFESIAGLGNVAGPVIDSLHLLKRLDDPVILASILRAFHDLRIDAVHCNLPQIISSITTSKDTKASYASLSSNEKSSSESADHELTENEKKKSSKLGGDLMNIMAEHADRMSEMDTMLLHSQQQDSHLNRYGNNEWWHPLLMPGLIDSEDWIGDDYEQVDVRHCDSRGEVNIVDMNCCLEAMSLRDCVKRCRRTVAEARQDETRWEEIQRSVLPSDHEALLRIKAITSEATLRETNSSVVRRLPDHLYTNHSALTLDYLPMLRGICRYEELRKEANLKRRFFHYLDSISFCLKPVTHLSLASILNPTQHP
ncbi:ATPase family AAA domain-containing protein 5 [Strongylocentrotus purpuratus]|uniref:AAA+ ATPase domain-containing protein n=1 Tax=Strongylocentrotus purpuratus TaxID=7668 RepID=A0A7M7NR03_STRPU|nr:ATPase family AAA domain-containing protein 5 [Strongylocentrotus purpuratus]XP_030839836.1 ATPase family AAA domain-containing protein 5 [Strongylocentrotus purpuratus]